MKTTSHNYTQWQENIPFDELPQTFQDAATITRALEIKYLWIDSFCIIQGDDDDWQKESGKMASTYAGAFLVISADKSRDCHGGFLHKKAEDRSSPTPLATIPTNNVDSSKSAVYIGELSHGCLFDHELLASRAWTLQENLLAPRMLHFTSSELVWECMDALCCECMYLDQENTGEIPTTTK